MRHAGESPAIFGDALRRLSGAATYLYQDAARYWYSTQPTVTKLAEDRAEQFRADPDSIVQELDKRIRVDLRNQGDFSRVHPLPLASQDVTDDLDARLVVLRIEYPYNKEPNSPAQAAAKAILETRGNQPRIYQNTLAFLAVDKNRLQDLDEAVRRYLAWQSIVDEKEILDLSPHQVRQAEAQKKGADSAVSARIPEAYQWLLVPVQPTPQSAIEWQVSRLTGQDQLAVRASKKLRNDELLVTGFAASRLRLELDQVPLWRGDHVAVKQLVEDFARYLYLPRLKNPPVLLKAIEDGLMLLSWTEDSFAYAESFDEESGRYRSIRTCQFISFSENNLSGLLVRPAVALKQIQAEAAAREDASVGVTEGAGGITATESWPGKTETTEKTEPKEPPKPKRFHGSVKLDPTRVGRDASRIAEELIAHLSGLVGAKVTVTLEVEAEIPSGVPDHVVRTVTENSRTLKFTSQGFEKE